MSRKLLLMMLISGSVFAQGWVPVDNEKNSLEVLEFMKDRIKNNWDSIQTISVEKSTDEYEAIYRAKIRVGYKMTKKCTKFGASCDTDSMNYVCNDITAKYSNNSYKIIEWDKKDCNM